MNTHRNKLIVLLALSLVTFSGCATSQKYKAASAAMKIKTETTGAVLTDLTKAQIDTETAAIDVLAIDARNLAVTQAGRAAALSGQNRFRSAADMILRVQNHDSPAHYFAAHNGGRHAKAYMDVYMKVLGDLQDMTVLPIAPIEPPIIAEGGESARQLYKRSIADMLKIDVTNSISSTKNEMSFKQTIGNQSLTNDSLELRSFTEERFSPESRTVDSDDSHQFADIDFAGKVAQDYGVFDFRTEELTPEFLLYQEKALTENEGSNRGRDETGNPPTESDKSDCGCPKAIPTIPCAPVGTTLNAKGRKSFEEFVNERYSKYADDLSAITSPLWRAYYFEHSAITIKANARLSVLADAKPLLKRASYIGKQGAAIDKRNQARLDLRDVLDTLKALDNFLGLAAVAVAIED